MIVTQFSKMTSHDITESLAYVPNAISTISVLKKKQRPIKRAHGYGSFFLFQHLRKDLRKSIDQSSHINCFKAVFLIDKTRGPVGHLGI